MTDETWRSAASTDGVFEVSSFGRVRTVERYVNCPLNGRRKVAGKICTPGPMKIGYLRVENNNGGVRKCFYVHRLVAEAFCANPHGLPDVNHLDGNKANNHPSNLEWCTHAQNMRHAREMRLLRQERPVIGYVGGVGEWFPSVNSTRRYGFSPACVSLTANGASPMHKGRQWAFSVMAA